MNIEELVAKAMDIKLIYAKKIVEFYNEKATVPFVSRYRKDQTGGMDEMGIAAAYDAIKLYSELFQRKEFVIEEIEKKGKLTDELREQINACWDPKRLEDIYLPYKEKRKTKAEKAKEAGLEPLAQILSGYEYKGEELVIASRFLNPEKGYDSPEKALEGATYITAQDVVEKNCLMEYFLDSALKTGVIISEKKKKYEGEDRRFEDYYEYTEKIALLKLPKNSHRYLALRRGEELSALSVKTEIDEEAHISALNEKYLKKEHAYKKYVKTAIETAYYQYLRAPIDTRIHQELFETAQNEAISVFSKNLEDLFMSPPIPYLNVIGMDPGIRTGIKTAILDKDGKFIINTVLHVRTPPEREASLDILKKLIKKYNIGAIGVGTGTGSKEAFSLANEAAEKCGEEIITALVDEAGASVYSASKTAREEFPDLDLTVRGAISIGRRLQNPLAELVKVDPRSIGVGQYQHDVDQKRLKEELERITEKCVNNIGVDLNTASYSILAKISGLAEKTAKNIVKYREENGLFTNREELRQVKGIGPKTYEQCAGFLRIREGNNYLDATRVHPEAYETIMQIAKDYETSIKNLIGNKRVLEAIKPEKYISDNLGKRYVESLIEDLKYPARDPRKKFRNVKFLEGVDSIEDLKPNMEMEGRITNVTNFGAFIDIGVHQDGLCHISQLGAKGIKSVKVGDIIKVKVINADPVKKRISLTPAQNA